MSSTPPAGSPGSREAKKYSMSDTLGVQQIEALEDHPQAVAELVASLRVDNSSSDWT